MLLLQRHAGVECMTGGSLQNRPRGGEEKGL